MTCARRRTRQSIPFVKRPERTYEETGLYYYGARYLDPKTSVWLSADPALGEYVPVAPVDDDAQKHNQNLPGMGGVFNTVNLHLYHYAGNNPVKYTDPDGREIVKFLATDLMTDYDNQVLLGNSNSKLREYGCYVTALGNAKGTVNAYSYRGGFGPGLDFKQTLQINNDKTLFGSNSGELNGRKASMDKIFGAGNWDYWTRASLGTQGLLTKLQNYANSGKKFIIVGVFDLSSATADVDNHMVGIVGLPNAEGIFPTSAIQPTSQGDKTRLSDSVQSQAYSMANLKEIRIIFLEGDL